MKNKIYKFLGHTVWYITYYWVDDDIRNIGCEKGLQTATIDTWESFMKWANDQEKSRGVTCCCIKKRHVTEDEFMLFIADTLF